jgi:hypothetical protein
MLIRKYRVPVSDNCEIEMPSGSKILHFGIEVVNLVEKGPFLWALVDTAEDLEDRHFRLVRSEGYLHEEDHVKFKYLGSVPWAKGIEMLHLFERTRS